MLGNHPGYGNSDPFFTKVDVLLGVVIFKIVMWLTFIFNAFDITLYLACFLNALEDALK